MDWILKEAESAFEKFPYPIKKPTFLVLDRKKFESYLGDSSFTLDIDKTPSFVAHLPDDELVCFCSEIINSLTRGHAKKYKQDFVSAITVHELFHIRNMHLALTEQEALKSEKEVHNQLRKEFPDLAKILDSLRK